MAEVSNENQIQVFISYAWESEELSKAVWDLACWLQKEANGKIKVEIDQLYAIRPPKQGWQTWMTNQVTESDIVLIVCTKTYCNRFSKKEPNLQIGKGVTWESAIVILDLYNTKLTNEKFFPITYEGHNEKHIPIVLQQFDNGHTFPSGNERILKLILNENPSFNLAEHGIENKNSCKESTNIVTTLAVTEQIIEELVPNLDNFNTMQSPIRHLVRTFMSLSEVHKLTISQEVGVFSEKEISMNPTDRDIAIFQRVKEKAILSRIWDSVNAIQPFEDQTNPFKN